MKKGFTIKNSQLYSTLETKLGRKSFHENVLFVKLVKNPFPCFHFKSFLQFSSNFITFFYKEFFYENILFVPRFVMQLQIFLKFLQDFDLFTYIIRLFSFSSNSKTDFFVFNFSQVLIKL